MDTHERFIEDFKAAFAAGKGTYDGKAFTARAQALCGGDERASLLLMADSLKAVREVEDAQRLEMVLDWARKVVPDPEAWLDRPCADLDGQTPRQSVADGFRGTSRVTEVLYRLEKAEKVA